MDNRLKKAIGQFETFLKQRGMRKTPERLEILAKALTFDGHFDIDELHKMVENDGFHVSLTTVYHTIDLMYEAGLLRKHLFDGQQARFEVTDNNHLHLVCLQCGKIQEADGMALLTENWSGRFHDFRPSYFSATVFGICAACDAKNAPQ